MLALVVQISFAQDRTISGTVTDDSGPLPGVSVLKKGSTAGTETDFDGNYSIKVKNGDVLVFRFVGLKTEERVVGTSNNISLVMQNDNLLEEVIVVGYGTTTKKAYAGTATTVKAENLEAKSFSNVSQALAGEVAGVTVINTSGQPGSIGTVRVRGYGSPLGNRNPLYVVDGIPFAGNFNLNSINPADIKNTTVLKDATATAIYGSRGANGVILITTKSGSKSSDNSYVEVDIKTGVNTQVIPRYDVLTSPEEYIGYAWEGLRNEGSLTAGVTNPVDFANNSLFTSVGAGAGYNLWNVTNAAALIDPTTGTVRTGVQRLFNPERYADIAFGDGIRQEANVRLGGGSSKSKYFFSAGYLDDSGYSLNSDFKRYTTRLNLNSDIKDWLNVGVNLGYAYSESTNNGQTVGAENIFEFADKMAPIYPVFARFPDSANLIPDPIFGGNQYDFGAPTGTANGFTRDRPISNLLNPIASALYDFDGRDTHSLNGSFSANFKLTDEFTVETRFGGQYALEKRNNVTNHVYGTAAGTNGSINVRNRLRWSQTFLQLLRYKKSFGDHNIEALVAHETFEQRFEQDQAFKQNVIVPGLYNLNNYLEASAPSQGYQNGSGIESYFGQLNYNYKGKYFLTGSLRTDGSSRFVNDKWGTFGSVGAAWIVSEEDFLQDSFISYLKAKASWGVTGDQQGATTSQGFDTFNSDFVGGGLALFLREAGDPNLTWETTKMLQGGIELSVGNYLDANFDYYQRNTDNLFFNQRTGPSAGIEEILVNDGEVQYNGFEFDVTAHLINKDDFKLDLSLNGEVLSNEMIRMPLDPSTGLPKILDNSSSTDGAYAYAEGRSIFDFYMPEWAGVDTTNGLPTWNQYYDDRNDNGVLDAGEPTSDSGGALWFIQDANDATNTNSVNGTGSLFEYQQKVSDANIKKTVTSNYNNATQLFVNKSLIPDVRGAFRLSAKAGGFDLSTQFTYSLGGYAYDRTYAELLSGSNNFHVDIRNRWQQPGDVTNIPLLANDAPEVARVSSLSSRFLTSTDFIALNNARIGYTVPKSFMSGSGIDLLNIWVSGDNLYNNTAREGFNPAINEDGGSRRRIYAPATTITLGVRVKF